MCILLCVYIIQFQVAKGSLSLFHIFLVFPLNSNRIITVVVIATALVFTY